MGVGKGEKREAKSATKYAPTGRKVIAQGIALGTEPPLKTQSPERAEEKSVAVGRSSKQ